MVNVIHKQLRFWKAINSEEGILQIMFPEITVKPKQQNAVLPKGGTIAPHLIHLIVPVSAFSMSKFQLQNDLCHLSIHVTELEIRTEFLKGSQ